METEMVKVPKEKFEKMEAELNELRKLVKESEESSQEQEEDELLGQVKASLEDLKAGRIERVA